MNEHSDTSLKEVWESFIISQTSRGVSEATIKNYHNHLKSISHHIDIEMALDALTKRHLEKQVSPLCSVMVFILRDYMAVRKGEPEDYLFCNQYGEVLSENALRLAVTHYNTSNWGCI